jgi:nucleoside phosphorylase
MLVIGSIAPDQDVARLLAQHLDNSLYYILPGPPDAYDRVCDTIEGRGLKLENYLVQGEWGEFNTFFGTLARKLAEDAPPVSGEPTQEWSRGRSTTQADVLLVTVTKIETEAVLELFPDYRPLHHADQTYYDLGLVQGARVFLVQQSTMGTGSPGGSLLTIFKGIHTLAPRTVIMVGIAFGFDETRQVLGDVLVSDQIQTYEQQRVGSGEQKELVILARGARPAVSPRLLSRFKSGAQSWQAARVFFGLILSGEKLIDHEGYRNQLRQFAPEALGGEMEGTGLHVAAEAHTLAHKVEWILVKAICDWADGNKELNKDRNQQQAARNAARFVCHVLQQGGFIN